jgi:hypothetical protein
MGHLGRIIPCDLLRYLLGSYDGWGCFLCPRGTADAR